MKASAERYNSDASLVYIDLDNFKEVNDTYGIVTIEPGIDAQDTMDPGSDITRPRPEPA